MSKCSVVTDFGFKWGNTTVERSALSPEGYQWLAVKTPREVLVITITPTGLIRTHVEKRRSC